ncbi:hypothetical protein EYF80_038121 [Liparis tanakae]|uniref:Uncharacterized protein n=1 Tax=Liparis tanakae TaxID=230148 RepID=A0A4Z2GEB7_9TELE|nr:hypothetical protein EYF80_038121 [Liparis tanakae]
MGRSSENAPSSHLIKTNASRTAERSFQSPGEGSGASVESGHSASRGDDPTAEFRSRSRKRCCTGSLLNTDLERQMRR